MMLARLQVAMDDAAGVGIGHRLTDLLEDRQKPGPILGGVGRTASRSAKVRP